MKTKHSTLLAMLLLIFSSIQGQDNSHYCVFDHAIKAKSENDPGYASNMQDIWANCQKNYKNYEKTGDTYYIPVVFHVVYNNDSQNLSDEVIFDQLNILNEDYSRNNPDADLTRDEFLPFAAGTDIQFYLAGEDPEGNIAIGIDRVETTRSGFEFDLFDISTIDEVKHSETGGADAWDPDHYLNIWICNIEPSFFGQIFGFAYPPEDAANWPEGQSAPTNDDEGVVIHYTVAGSNNPSADEDGFPGNEGGRTLTHEVGHYFGLRHTWGDAGFFDDGCDVDDGIDDTPNISNSANFACDLSGASCDGVYPAMIENFMDYNLDVCLNMFTEEQAAMMLFNLLEYRPGLIDGGVIISVEENHESSMILSPNPAEQSVHVSLLNTNFDKGNVNIYNQSGKRIEQLFLQGREALINLDYLSSGLYILEFSDGNKILRKRFVKI